MRCPSLADLPPPPSGKTGWPWTIESPQLPDTMPDGKAWPRVSIVTPSYNQGEFIEETIRSILLQGYPNLEYIIMDGGSSDDTISIIKRYEKWLDYWKSQPDEGQAMAINEGMSRTNGEILNWINSDDLIARNALYCISSLYGLDSEIDVISGARIARFTGCEIEKIQIPWIYKWVDYSFGFPDFPQESSFFSKRIWSKVGCLEKNMTYSFDVAFFFSVLREAKKICVTDVPIGIMNVHEMQKTKRQDIKKQNEGAIMLNKYEPINLRAIMYKKITYSRLRRFRFVLHGVLKTKIEVFYGYWSFELKSWLLSKNKPN